MAVESPLVSVPVYPKTLAASVFRSVNRRRAARWRSEVLLLLVEHVLSNDTPYHYQSAFSFLQPQGLQPQRPVTIDLYLPDYSLFLDVLSEEWSEDYRIARYYLARKEWEAGQEVLEWKKERLRSYHVPYLTIHSYDAVAPLILRQRIDGFTGTSRYAFQPLHVSY